MEPTYLFKRYKTTTKRYKNSVMEGGESVPMNDGGNVAVQMLEGTGDGGGGPESSEMDAVEVMEVVELELEVLVVVDVTVAVMKTPTTMMMLMTGVTVEGMPT